MMTVSLILGLLIEILATYAYIYIYYNLVCIFGSLFSSYPCFLNICCEPITPSSSVRTNKYDMDSAFHCLYKNVFCNIFLSITL